MALIRKVTGELTGTPHSGRGRVPELRRFVILDCGPSLGHHRTIAAETCVKRRQLAVMSAPVDGLRGYVTGSGYLMGLADMLSLNEALAAAARYLAETSEGIESIRTNPEAAFAVDGMLIVPWNSKALLDEGDIDAELGGNPDIGVDLSTGRCRYLDLIDSFEFQRRRDDW